jgi:HAMP domain-containing protein
MFENPEKSNNNEEAVVVASRRGRLAIQIGIPLVFFILLFLVALFGSFYFTYAHSKEMFESIPAETARTLASRVDERIRTTLAMTDLLSEIVSAGVVSDHERVIQGIMDKHPMISSVAYFSTGSSSAARSFSRANNVSFDHSNIQARRPTSGRLIDGPLILPGGDSVLLVSYPIRASSTSKTAPVSGRFVVVLDLLRFSDLFVGMSVVGVGITDGVGNIFLASQDEVRTQTTPSIIDSFKQNKREIIIGRSDGGQYFLKAWAKAGVAPIGVIAEIPYSRVFRDVNTLFIFVGVITAILFIVLLFELFTLRKRLFTPLGALSKSAEDMARGNLDQWVPVDVNNELGALAQTLNLLAFRLRWSQQGLQERIEAATREAEVKAEEAERLNSFMVNREIKMAELKEELRKYKNGEAGDKPMESSNNGKI